MKEHSERVARYYRSFYDNIAYKRHMGYVFLICSNLDIPTRVLEDDNEQTEESLHLQLPSTTLHSLGPTHTKPHWPALRSSRDFSASNLL